MNNCRCNINLRVWVLDVYPDVILKSLYLTPYQEYNSGGQSVACNLKHILGQILSPKDIAGYDIMKLKSDNAATAALSSMQTKGQKGGTITKAKLFSE